MSYFLLNKITFFVSNLSGFRNRKSNESNDDARKFSDHQHVPIPTKDEDEDESEASFTDDDNNGLLDRLGVKIDDRLHTMFTAYVVPCSNKCN